MLSSACLLLCSHSHESTLVPDPTKQGNRNLTDVGYHANRATSSRSKLSAPTQLHCYSRFELMCTVQPLDNCTKAALQSEKSLVPSSRCLLLALWQLTSARRRAENFPDSPASSSATNEPWWRYMRTKASTEEAVLIKEERLYYTKFHHTKA